MGNQEFDSILKRIQDSYGQQDYQAALDLTDQALLSYSDQKPLFSLWQISLLACLRKTSQSLDHLEDLLREGQWFNDILLRKSPALRTLNGTPRFEFLLEKNAILRREDPESSFPMLVLRSPGKCEGQSSPCPLLIGLHAGNSTAALALKFWQPAASSDWLVAVPQSSQAMWKGAYNWDDRETSLAEVVKHYSTLRKKYSIDSQRIIAAGLGTGGEIAFWISISGTLKNRGFIFINPTGSYFDDPENYLEEFKQIQNPGLRGYVIVEGNKSSPIFEKIAEFSEISNQNKVPCQFEAFPTAAWEVSSAYKQAFQRAIEFILE